MRALDDVVRAGKVRYVGMSDAPAWTVSRANTMAELRGWSSFVGLQIPYSLIERTVERELLPMAAALGITVTPWGCLASGVLSGKYNDDRSVEGRASSMDRITDRGIEIARTTSAVADEIGRTSAQVALAWVRRGQGRIVPILGARVVSQLEEQLGCLDLELEDAHVQHLEEASHISLGFPMDFLASRGPRR